MKLIFSLRIIAVLTTLIFTTSTSFCEIVKCVGLDGDVVYANSTCPDGYRIEKSFSGNVSSAQESLTPFSVKNAKSTKISFKGIYNGQAESNLPKSLKKILISYCGVHNGDYFNVYVMSGAVSIFSVVYIGETLDRTKIYKKVPLSIALQKHSLPHNSKPKLGFARGRNGQVWGLVDVSSAISYRVANPYSANSFVEKVTYLLPSAPVLSITSRDCLTSNQIANILSFNNSTISEADKDVRLKKTRQSYAHSPRNSADEITEMCQEKWGNNYEMVNYCIKNQRNAKREVSGYSGTIRNNCENKWGSNYEMVLHCIKNQRAAKRAIDNDPEDEISRFCRKKWGSNYEMVNHCTKNQRAAKENIERNYSGYVRKQCEEKWGNNYEMIEYCIKNQ